MDVHLAFMGQFVNLFLTELHVLLIIPTAFSYEARAVIIWHTINVIT